MRTFTLILMLVLAAPALILTTGGCGGSDGAAPSGGMVIAANPNESFFGGYFWQLWNGEAVGPTNRTQWGIVTADGAGLINAGVVVQNEAGVLTGPGPIPQLPYSVSEDGDIDITVGVGTLSGGITEDGSVLAVAQATAGLNPALAIVPRGLGVYNNASLNGEYHYCTFWHDGAGNNDIANWGTVTFNGAGGAFDYAAGINIAGVIFPPGAPAAWGVYNVEPNGRMTWGHPTTSVSGGIGLGGDLIVLTGSSMASNLQRLEILIRKGAGLNDATFSGTYHTVVLEADPAFPPRYQTRVSRTTADGAGMLTLGDEAVNTDGVTSTNAYAGIGLPYSVGADGTLQLIGGILQGGVSPDGRVAVLAGNTGGGHPQIWFFFR